MYYWYWIQNVAVIQERNDNEEPDPTPTISWTQIFNDRGPETPSDEKPKTSLAYLQLPQTEEYIQTDQLCPNTRWDILIFWPLYIRF